MKKLLWAVAGIFSFGNLTGQTLQSVTEAGGTTSNPIVISPPATATTVNTIAPALLLNPDYLKTGAVKQIVNFNVNSSKTGVYRGITPTTLTGNGTGLVMDVTIIGNLLAQATPVNGGSGYSVGDRLSVSAASFGGGAGQVNVYIADVTSNGNFSYANAPLHISPSVLGMGYTGAYTSIMSFDTRFQNNMPANAYTASLGYYWKTPTTPTWAFMADNTYALGLSQQGVDMNEFTATTINNTSMNNTLLTIPDGSINLNGVCNNAFIAQNNFYAASGPQEGNVFLSNTNIEPAAAATQQHFSALTNTSSYGSKTGDQLYTVRSAPVINLEATANCNVYGYYYNPTILNLRGKHIAYQNTTGDAYFCSTSGNVGIGTNNPKEKLSVKGTLLAQKVIVSISPSDWPDFVFTPGHSCLSAAQTEAYIRQHKHLPGVPSAEQTAQTGLDTGNTQALLLQKIEELTLLILRQQKQLTQQSKRISELETEQ